jgi:hypothetical protein
VADDGGVKKQPSKKAVVGVIAFFLLGGLGMLAGAAYAWNDEQGGVAGKAYVTRCTSAGSGSGANVHCDATWTYKGHPASGWVENARMSYEGKAISVRIHGTDHVTVATYWVPIGLGVMGLFVLGCGVMLLVQIIRRRQPA